MRTLIAIVGLAVVLPGAVTAAVCGSPKVCIINNGLMPPNPDNVIDHATYEDGYEVGVRNVDCPPGWPASGGAADDCSAPGAPTEVAFTDGGKVFALGVFDSSAVTMSGGTAPGGLHAYDSSIVGVSGGELDWSLTANDSSTVVMMGGAVQRLEASDASIVTMSGGTVVWSLSAAGSSTVTMRGGTVGGDLGAAGTSSVRIVGRDFEVDGVSVPYGDLKAPTGTLTGVLASGEHIDNVFHHGDDFDCTPACTGTITLEYAPEPGAALLTACALVTLALLRRRSADRPCQA